MNNETNIIGTDRCITQFIGQTVIRTAKCKTNNTFLDGSYMTNPITITNVDGDYIYFISKSGLQDKLDKQTWNDGHWGPIYITNDIPKLNRIKVISHKADLCRILVTNNYKVWQEVNRNVVPFEYYIYFEPKE